MKKKKAKALKQLAIALPDAFIRRPHTETGFLWELHRLVDDGQKIEGLPVLTEENKDSVRSITYQATEKLDHYRRLKKVYQEKGTKGIQEYIVWLNLHNKRWAEKMEGIEQVEPGLLEIAKMNVSSFWKSLIVFLFSFMATFMKKEEA